MKHVNSLPSRSKVPKLWYVNLLELYMLCWKAYWKLFVMTDVFRVGIVWPFPYCAWDVTLKNIYLCEIWCSHNSFKMVVVWDVMMCNTGGRSWCSGGTSRPFIPEHEGSRLAWNIVPIYRTTQHHIPEDNNLKTKEGIPFELDILIYSILNLQNQVNKIVKTGIQS
jgi:hypothetical protein